LIVRGCGRRRGRRWRRGRGRIAVRREGRPVVRGDQAEPEDHDREYEPDAHRPEQGCEEPAVAGWPRRGLDSDRFGPRTLGQRSASPDGEVGIHEHELRANRLRSELSAHHSRCRRVAPLAVDRVSAARSTADVVREADEEQRQHESDSDHRDLLVDLSSDRPAPNPLDQRERDVAAVERQQR
jgi:hypothetical protein